MLSNFFQLRVSVVVDGVEFQNSEAAFHAAKALRFGDKDSFEAIRRIPEHNPAIAKKLGKMVRGYDENIWDLERDWIMDRILISKFSRNPELRDSLMNTEDRILVEARLD